MQQLAFVQYIFIKLLTTKIVNLNNFYMFFVKPIKNFIFLYRSIFKKKIVIFSQLVIKTPAPFVDVHKNVLYKHLLKIFKCAFMVTILGRYFMFIRYYFASVKLFHILLQNQIWNSVKLIIVVFNIGQDRTSKSLRFSKLSEKFPPKSTKWP